MHIAYLAGIVDGEGSIMIPATGVSRIRDETIHRNHTIHLSIAGTEPSMLKAIRHWYGGKINHSMASKLIDTKNYRQGYKLIWMGRDAIDIISKIQPHLIIKARQAELAIHFQCMRDMFGYKKHKNAAELLELNQIAARVKALNARGARSPYSLAVH